MPTDTTQATALLLAEAEASLMAERHHDALQLCDRAALQSDSGRYGAALLRGTILLDMGDARGALSSYDSVADPKVPDAELDCARGLALFELARLAEAENALRSAVRGAPHLARAHFALGLIAELLGNGEEAEHFRKARKLEPENYPPQRRTGAEEFQKAVTAAIDSLSDAARGVLRKMSVLVAELPNPQDLVRQNPPVSPQAPCMVVGVLDAQSDDPEDVSAVEVGVLLFKRNLERLTTGTDDLTHNVREALLHVLEGTFKGPPTRVVEAATAENDTGAGGAASGDDAPGDGEKNAAGEPVEEKNSKLQDLHAWRRKKGLTSS